jgi:UDP-N-acetyl-D-mannosaminuronic acid dehydrogenase
MTFNPVSIVGLGYIGLPTAAVLASRGIDVIGVDLNVDVVDTINRGQIHIVEPDLDMLVYASVTAGRLRATTKPEPASAFIIAVPTPFTEGHKPDLSHIEAAARAIAPVLQKGNLVILESTSPVGTTEKLAEWLAAARPDLNFPQQAAEAADVQIAYCPERVLPGKILHELIDNDRIVGGMTRKACEMAVGLYKTFVEGECIRTDARTAEMCKLAENTYRDINIAYANELSMICDQLGIDVWQLIALANHHPRVNILKPGPGVGGHCIAVDPWFIVDKTPEQARLIRTAREVNDEKTRWAMSKIDLAITREIECGTFPQDIGIACLGLTYKANIDDLRESPALSIVQSLAKKHPGHVAVVEPHIDMLPGALSGLEVALLGLQEAIDWAKVVVLLVDHKQFKEIDFDRRDIRQMIDLVGIRKVEQ